MKVTILAIIVAAGTAFALQALSQSTGEPIKVRACLQGNGSAENPWSLRGVVLPAPAGAAPAAPQGGRGDGGVRGGGGAGRGRGGDEAAQPGAAGGRGAPAGGRGGDGARGAAPAAAPAPPSQPPVDLRLTGLDLTPWRNMFVEVEGVL